MATPKQYLESNAETKPNDRICGVFIPFDKEFDAVFSNIRQACEAVGMEAQRVDENPDSAEIFEDMMRLIVEAALIIVDVTDRKPNVMYELGICHTVKERIIILSQGEDELPFNIHGYRHIKYSKTQEDLWGDNLQLRLGTEIERLMNKPDKTRISFVDPELPPTTEYIPGIMKTLRAVVEELNLARHQHKDQTCLIRAIPAEFTATIFRRDIDSEARDLLNEYKNFISNIVNEGTSGVDNWDYTTYGRIGKKNIDKATFEFIKEVYFSGKKLPDTSEIGLAESINMVGFFVIGKSIHDILHFEPDITIFLFPNADGDPNDSCAIVRNPQFSQTIVRQWFRILRERAQTQNQNWDLLRMHSNPRDIPKMVKKIEKFIVQGKLSWP